MDSERVYVSMVGYVDVAVRELQFEHISTREVPISQPITDLTPVPVDGREHKRLRKALGILGWMVAVYRFDLAYVHSMIAQFTAKPVRGALSAIDNVFKYVKATRDFALSVPIHTERNNFLFFTDSDHAANPGPINARRSQFGAIVIMNGAPIYWKSTVDSNATSHPNMTMAEPVPSVGEAETMALSNGVSAFTHISYVIEEMSLSDFPLPIPIRTDSKTAEAFAKGTLRSKMKHIDTRQQWVCAMRNHEIIKVSHIPGVDNLADILTKIPTKAFFLKCRNALCIFK